MTLINGRDKFAQIYPPELCRAMCKGLRQQMKADQKGQFMLATVKQGDDMHKEAQQKMQQCKQIEEENDEELEIA